MRGNIDNPPRLRYVQLAAAGVFQVVAGVAGYVDTDVSGTTGVYTNRIWFINAWVNGAAGQNVSARPHGAAADAQVPAYASASLMSCVDSSGHMDLLRNATHDVFYSIVGYLSD